MSAQYFNLLARKSQGQSSFVDKIVIIMHVYTVYTCVYKYTHICRYIYICVCVCVCTRMRVFSCNWP